MTVRLRCSRRLLCCVSGKPLSPTQTDVMNCSAPRPSAANVTNPFLYTLMQVFSGTVFEKASIEAVLSQKAYGSGYVMDGNKLDLFVYRPDSSDPDYCAAWVLDPDGHDVEVVNKTGQID
jgi:hypothetical protein